MVVNIGIQVKPMILKQGCGIKITAICGWAIAPEWFHERIARSFPNAQIKAIYPHHPENQNEAREILTSNPSDLYIGYSMGSLWLMHHRQHLPPNATKTLLAPILAFTKERNLGGRISISQIKFFIKMLKSSSGDTQALGDFYSLCNFIPPESWKTSIPDHPSLIRGLEFLCTTSVEASSADGFMAVIGEEDKFLDPIMLKYHLPHLSVVAHTGHEPEPLLDYLSQQLKPLLTT